MIRNRKIGPFLATMLVANNMIGSGIFLLPATLATVGSITIFGWILATLGALLSAAVLAKLGQIAPEAGGPVAYAGEALGPYMGFQATVLYWVCAWVGNMAIALAAVGYLATFFPSLAIPLNAAFAAAGLIWLVTLINILGPRFACQVESVTLVAGLIPILLVATAGWFWFDPDTFLGSWNVSGQPAYRAIPGSLVLVYWAFVGLESASVGTAIVENPARNVPLATIAGVLLAGVVYIASCTVIMGLIPARALAESTAPFADAARFVIGPAAASLVAFMACLKASGTLCGWVLLTAQVGKAGAERGNFPAVFARTDRHGIPVINLIIMATIMTAVVFLTMSPTLGQQFSKLIEVSVVLCLLIYVYSSLAIWHYGNLVPFEGFGIYRVIAFFAMLASLCVIVLSGSQMLALTAVIVLATCALYPFFLRKPGVRGAGAGPPSGSNAIP
ncbi:MAG: amino acid permease [Gammaproteobacteria bacterium]